ncbi:MAG: AAA family ATPase [Fusobacterium perfoetens]|uniref:AAA family ATPase n=1 Tax=Fusobacterium perfoetens TaxID=852 RepID=UPI0023F3DD03|nr:AAA family ATPase [Fusobacterium perfoetens]MCI6152386.1 AAA family ATPase [Fusobacterium perfoetens]MDY3236985.1 AAA family ATPase [Fusobacterium perfoetens]
MLIKYIKIKNFRQFKNLEMNFSTDCQKNVSIISGNNGSGKTTLAQAFTWCLYTETIYNTLLLNADIEKSLALGESAEVSVEIILEHDNTEYTIIRKQTYTRKQKDKVTTSNQDISTKMFKKTIEGKTETIRESGIDIEIDKILPKDLSKYFFFAGERIAAMSESVKKGGKNSELSKAVKSLLGLAPFLEAKEHLNPNSKQSVIGEYKNLYKIDGNEIILKLNDEIERYENLFNKATTRIEEIEEELEKSEELKEQIRKELLQYEDSQHYEKERINCEKEIVANISSRINLEKDILSFLNEDTLSFMSQYYIKKAISDLEKYNFTEKDIPDLHSRTIDYILKNKKCLCGHEIIEGSEEYKTLINLREKLPPHSIGISVANFLNTSKNKINNKDIYQKVKEKYAQIKEIENKILNLKDTLSDIDKKLSGGDVLVKVKQLNAELNNIKYTKRSLNTEKDELNRKKGEYDIFLTDRKNKKEKKLLENKENIKISIYKKYAEAVYEDICKSLDEREHELRERLEEEVDKIFNTIYVGQLNITIDEKYNISTTINKEISDGQSTSVILSFIAGIIKLSKEAKLDTENDFYGEPYPLVMDAPLSNFDKNVIKNICNVLPNIAEQVIIFIKDTDGDLAKEHLSNRIGIQKQLRKIDEFNTELI